MGTNMTHEERRRWLIERLKSESREYDSLAIPRDENGQRDILRALMNVRPPRETDEEFLAVQDRYLADEAAAAGVTDAGALPACEGDPRLVLWQGDITKLKCGAIVNAANSQMLGCFQPLHNCIDNCIHTYSGVQLRSACADYMNARRRIYGGNYEQPTAEPMMTDAYNLPAEKVIHVVGPIVYGSLTEEHCGLLAKCYTSCLDLADEAGLGSIAFCCISTGVFMFPAERAAEIAVATVKDWLDSHSADTAGDDQPSPGRTAGTSVKRVIFNVFKDSDLEIYQNLLGNFV